jgi:hypothetical protein
MDLLFNQAPSAENLTQTAVIIEPEPMVLTAESMDSVATQETKIGENEVD